MGDLGPVSATLEREVANEVRRQGIVVWLDKDAAYTAFVDGLADRNAISQTMFPVVRFRGSFLDVLFQLDRYGSGLDREPLLVHMPGFNEETIRKTPILELYEPGVRFRKGLDTLIREAAQARVPPDKVEAFVATSPTLEKADAWLAAAMNENLSGLASLLTELGPTLLVQSLAGGDSTLRSRVSSPEDEAALSDYLLALTGMDDQWVRAFGPGSKLSPFDNALAALGAWLLSVEYVHDLRRKPHLQALQRLREVAAPTVKACVGLVQQLRANHGEAYMRIADEVEGMLAEELHAMTPEDLGQIDTFREEEVQVLKGAVGALQQGDWTKATSWCEARHGEKSFWLQRDQGRRWAWVLVAEAAAFGAILAEKQRPLAGAQSVEEGVQRYADDAQSVDRAHRRFEQKWLTLRDPRMPHYGPYQEVVGTLRRLHRTWADTLNNDFAALCSDHGFLPSAEMQQRTLYEQAVHPLTFGGEKVALFVIDAFRYEMAVELADDLKGGGAVVDLKPRLAELPTITSVGMNALAPVAQADRLVVAGTFQGFKTGEFTVRTPADRARAMGMRSTGKHALLLTLAEVCESNAAALTKKVAQHGLVLVHSREIDDAGEANVGLPTFESTLRQLKAAWHHLHTAGVKHFVFSADHGFLLKDETTQAVSFGAKTAPHRRYVLDEYARQEQGMTPVSLASLRYDGVTGYLLLRTDTAVFDTGQADASFVHGGNSMQERVIPVLTVSRKRAEVAGLVEYAVDAEPLPDVVGLHRLRLRIGFAKGSAVGLQFATAPSVDVGLRAHDREDIRAAIKDVSGAGSLQKGRVRLPVGGDWTEVFFALEGPADGRARVEVHHPDALEKVSAAVPDDWFSVVGQARPKGGSVRPPPDAPASWADAIENEGIRAVFQHIERHGVITEPEVTAKLGSARAFRKFSLEFEVHLVKLPFRVRIEPGEGGKRYVREGDR